MIGALVCGCGATPPTSSAKDLVHVFSIVFESSRVMISIVKDLRHVSNESCIQGLVIGICSAPLTAQKQQHMSHSFGALC